MKSFEFNQNKHINVGNVEGKIVDREVITDDYFGSASNVTRLSVQFGDHQRSLVLKDFHTQGHSDDEIQQSKNYVTHSIDMWTKIKEAGLPTYDTYRPEKDGTSILMTDLKVDGFDALSVTNAPTDWYDESEDFEKKISSIENFSELIHDIKHCAKVASNIGVRLQPDAYFFLVKEVASGAYTARLFIGDFEYMNFPEEMLDWPDTDYATNLKLAHQTLKAFVESFVNPDVVNVYIHMLTEHFTELQPGIHD